MPVANIFKYGQKFRTYLIQKEKEKKKKDPHICTSIYWILKSVITMFESKSKVGWEFEKEPTGVKKVCLIRLILRNNK